MHKVHLAHFLKHLSLLIKGRPQIRHPWAIAMSLDEETTVQTISASKRPLEALVAEEKNDTVEVSSPKKHKSDKSE